MQRSALLLGICLVGLLAGCSRLGGTVGEPPSSAPVTSPDVVPARLAPSESVRLGLPAPRQARASDSGLARLATNTFRTALAAGDYESLPRATYLLTAAALENPLDPEVALLLGHAHLWRVSERKRVPAPDPTITDHLMLAEAYFAEAYRLRPDDARIVGWLGSARLAVAGLRHDSTHEADALALLDESVRRYPAFNHFTTGFVTSGLPTSDPRFAGALEHLWQNVEACVGGRGAAAPEGAGAYVLAAQTDPACANTTAAPHNYEGFMLTLGDVLVKANRPDEARAVYARARFSPTYEEWPYRDKIEQRLLSADEAAALFARSATDPSVEAPESVFGSAYSCTVCHQR